MLLSTQSDSVELNDRCYENRVINEWLLSLLFLLSFQLIGFMWQVNIDEASMNTWQSHIKGICYILYINI